MKFEVGKEQAWRDERKKKGKKLSFFDKYKDFNCEKVPELLEKRKENEEVMSKRQQGKIAKMKKAEAEGKIVFRDNI